MKIVIFETNSNEDRLEKLLLSLDKSFHPIGTGGYAVREKEIKKYGFTIFLFTEQDVAPQRTFPLALKGNKIWASIVADTIFEALSRALIKFSVSYTKQPPLILI